MKILFFIEPWIELNIPFWKRDYIWWFKDNILKAFENNIDDTEAMFIINEGIELDCDTSSMQFYDVIHQHELLEIFSDSTVALKAWQNSSFTENELHSMIMLIKKKLCNFVPDIIFTISPVPYLSQLFPNAKIFHKHGFNLREPFPDEMLSFDHSGLYGNSIWGQNIQFFKENNLTKSDTDFIESFKAIFKPIFDTISSENYNTIDMIKSKFNHLILFPLQHNDHNIYRHSTDYLLPSIIEKVFSRLDSSIGVIVTQHPDSMLLKKDQIAYFKKKYKNFIYLTDTESMHSPSQDLLLLTDGIISVASHLSFLALILDKPIFSCADSHINKISDNNSIYQIKELLERGCSNNDFKNLLLLFFIKKYNFNYEYFQNHEWLYNRFMSISQSTNIDSYPDIDTSQKILDSYIDRIRIPKKMKDIYHDSVTKSE